MRNSAAPEGDNGARGRAVDLEKFDRFVAEVAAELYAAGSEHVHDGRDDFMVVIGNVRNGLDQIEQGDRLGLEAIELFDSECLCHASSLLVVNAATRCVFFKSNRHAENRHSVQISISV